jgi:hypothetical protein
VCTPFPRGLRRIAGGSATIIALLAGTLPAQRTAKAAEHDARSAQRGFETTRRMRLPTTPPHGSSCEVTIGRLCYWDDNDDAPLPAEPFAITREREKLRDALDRAAVDAPASDWIVGQRVRYALEAHDTAGVRTIVSGCAATEWWCAALVGLVRHTLGEDSLASVAYDDALRAMPDTARCAWLDVRIWLPHDAAKLLDHASCAERAEAAERLFWVAAPLLTWRPAAARNEWLARQTMAMILKGTALPSGLGWGSDVADVSLRFGWPVRWAREDRDPRMGDPFDVPVMGHEPTPSWSFVPSPRAIATPDSAVPDDWVLSHVAAPPMRYAPAGLRKIVPLTVQIARFRRDSSTRVVVAYDASSDMAPDSSAAAIPAALVAAAPDSVLTRAHGDTGAVHGALLLDAPLRSALAAVEVVDSSHAAAARWRAGVAPLASDALVSDILVGRAGGAPVPTTLDGALPLAVASLTVPEGSTLALYWEQYVHPSAAAPVTITLRLVPHRAGLAGRVVHALGIGSEKTPIALEWSDPGVPDERAGRSLRLALPSVAPGRYTLELVVAGDTLRGRATREIVVAPAR